MKSRVLIFLILTALACGLILARTRPAKVETTSPAPGQNSPAPPKAMRTMTVKISGDRTLIDPMSISGVRVDVVHTVRGISRVMVEDLFVLGIQKNEDQLFAKLELATAEQEATLTQGSKDGTLTLVLRVPDEAKNRP
jgi:hypothetical protein